MVLFRASLFLPVCFLLPLCLSAGELSRRVDMACLILPPALLSPLVDGDGSDLAWRAPSAQCPPFNGALSENISAKISADDVGIFLLFENRALNAGETLTIEIGSAPWLTRQVRLRLGKEPEESAWDGLRWEDAPPVFVIREKLENASRMIELYLPFTAFAPTGSFDLVMRAVLAEGTRLAVLDLSRRGGIKVFKHCAPLFFEWSAANRQSLKIGWQNWQEENTASLTLLRGDKCQRLKVEKVLPGKYEQTVALPDEFVSLFAQGKFPACAFAAEGQSLLVFPGTVGEAPAATESAAAFPAGPDDAQVDRLQDTLLSGCYDVDGIPDWLELQKMAGRYQYARAAFINALCFLPVEKILRDKTEAERAQVAGKMLEQWRDYSSSLPAFDSPYLHPAWRPDIAAVRARVLSLLPGVREEEISQTRDAALNALLASGCATAFSPETCLNLAATVKGNTSPACNSLLKYASSLQLRAHLNPDGSPRLADGSAVAVLASLLQLENLAPSPPGEEFSLPGFSIRLAPAEKLLHYLAYRVMPDARACRFLLPPGFAEDNLSRWSEKYFPQNLSLKLFLPEGQAAAALENTPVANPPEPEYGGLYLLRGGSLSATVFAPANLPGSEKVYGAVSLATPLHNLLLEEIGSTGKAPVLIDGFCPTALPPLNQPLPHRFMQGNLFDALTCNWLIPGGKPASASRTVMLVKTYAKRDYLLVSDAVEMASDSCRLEQSFRVEEKNPGELAYTHLGQTKVLRRINEAGVLFFANALQGKGAAEVIFHAGNAGDKEPLVISPLGERFTTGGGCVEAGLPGGMRDILVSNPALAVAETGFPQGKILLAGRFALFRLGKMGLAAAGFFQTTQAEMDCGPRWRFGFSAPVDAEMVVRPNGSYALTLVAAETSPVEVTIKLFPLGGGETRQATVFALPRKTVVFRLL
jgi:hypothetical protein